MIVTSAILFGILGGVTACVALAFTFSYWLRWKFAEAETELLHEDGREYRKRIHELECQLARRHHRKLPKLPDPLMSVREAA